MKIETKIAHTITFSVQSFQATQGGMDHDHFGKECNTLSEAIEQLRMAEVSGKDGDWIIVCDVATIVSEAK